MLCICYTYTQRSTRVFTHAFHTYSAGTWYLETEWRFVKIGINLNERRSNNTRPTFRIRSSRFSSDSVNRRQRHRPANDKQFQHIRLESQHRHLHQHHHLLCISLNRICFITLHRGRRKATLTSLSPSKGGARMSDTRLAADGPAFL